MKVRIHRGAAEIGGSCVELESSGRRLVLDLGMPLATRDTDAVALPPVGGLAGGDSEDLLGIVVSHPHEDHWGLLPRVHARVPIFIGEAAAQLLRAAPYFGASGVDLTPTGFLRDRTPLDVGPFRVTPYLADHSAYDAYSLRVEADERVLFYTGDLRGHGRHAQRFEGLLADPPRDVDVVLMEGTNVRTGAGEPSGARTEAELQEELALAFQRTTGLALVACSGQNFDRMATVYEAARRADREFVVDLYAATMATATGSQTVPQPGHPGLRVFLPHRQRVRVKTSGEFWRARDVRPWRVFPEELAAQPERFVVIFRASMVSDLERAQCLGGAALVWSMWSGYLAEADARGLADFRARHGIPLEIRHTSGHASVADLRRLADALAPARVVPIHTEAPERFAALFPRVETHADGKWWDV